MNEYEALAKELMHSIDQHKKAPPHERISASMRGEMAVLRLLEHETQPLTAGEISRKLGMTTPRIAAVLGSLEKKGMILRQIDEHDKRRVLVILTDKGCKFCQQKKELVLGEMTRMLSQLGSEDAAHFVRIVKRIHEFMPPSPPGMDNSDKEEFADEQ